MRVLLSPPPDHVVCSVRKFLSDNGTLGQQFAKRRALHSSRPDVQNNSRQTKGEVRHCSCYLLVSTPVPPFVSRQPLSGTLTRGPNSLPDTSTSEVYVTSRKGSDNDTRAGTRSKTPKRFQVVLDIETSRLFEKPLHLGCVCLILFSMFGCALYLNTSMIVLREQMHT